MTRSKYSWVAGAAVVTGLLGLAYAALLGIVPGFPVIVCEVRYGQKDKKLASGGP